MKKYIWFLMCIVSSCIVSAAISHNAFASGSWTSGTFSFGDEALISNSEQDCVSRRVKIGGPLASVANVCVYERPNWRYGFYTEVSGPPYAPYYNHFLVVGIGADTNMYKVVNPGYSQSYEVVHLPGTNDFMYNRLTAGFTNNHALYIARNFPAHLTRSYSGLDIVYTLASNSYEPLIPDGNANPVTTGAVGVSPNGRWVAVEIMGSGLALINTENYRLQLFSNYKHQYGLGSDAHITFVISDDGKYVATFDYNIQPKVYSLSSACTLAASNFEAIHNQLNGYISCQDDDGRLQQALVDKFGSQTARSMSATKFNYDTDTLYFVRTEYDDPDLMTYKTYLLPLHAGDFQMSTDLKYLALGDSYASGEGDIERMNGVSYYTPVTDYTSGCHVSTRSYPFLLASKNGLPNDRMQSVACSGAQIYPDYIGEPETYIGQGKRLKDYSIEDRKEQQKNALKRFIPGKMPQIEFVKKYQPSILTLMGGGNDVGFAGIIEYCAIPGWEGIFWDDTCGYAIDGSDLRHMLGVSIRDQYGYMKRLLTMIHEVSPRTVVYVVGYPSFISDSTFDTCLNSAALDIKERKMLNEAVSYANAVLKQATETSGAYFIDIEDVLDGGRMCEGSEYVTGLQQVGITKVINKDVQEMFHPNAKAHQKIANAITSQGFSLEATLPMVQSDIPAPSLPAYFGGPSSESISSARQYQMVSNAEVPKQSTGELSLDKFSFQNSSSASLTIHSSPMQLGTYPVEQDGSLRATFTLPSSIEPGRHVLVLEGISPSGEAIKYFQFFTVTSGKVNDVDGDGIPDDQDVCPFINEWYDEQTHKNVCLQEKIPPLAPNVSANDHENSNQNKKWNSYNSTQFADEEMSSLIGLETSRDKSKSGAAESSVSKNSSLPHEPQDKKEPYFSGRLILLSIMTLIVASVILITIKYIKERHEQ